MLMRKVAVNKNSIGYLILKAFSYKLPNIIKKMDGVQVTFKPRILQTSISAVINLIAQ